MNGLLKIEQTRFHNVICDVYTNQQGEFFMTREQIGRALEYSRPEDAIYRMHARDKERLDKFSVVVKLSSTDGKKYDTYLYNARGIYEICRHSHQPKANEFYDHVYDVLEALRLGFAKLQVERQTPQWQEARTSGKTVRRLETDGIKRFIVYAETQGSKRADWYYCQFTKMVYAVIGLEPGRDGMSTAQLLNLQFMEQTINSAIDVEIAAGVEYHEAFQHVKQRIQQVASLALLTPSPALLRERSSAGAMRRTKYTAS